jgi:hypothetical protein
MYLPYPDDDPENFPGPSGTGNPVAMTYNSYNRRFTAMVDVEVLGDGTNQVRYAWLRDLIGGGNVSNSIIQTGTVVSGASGVEYAFPRCDAMYVAIPGPSPNGDHIYLAVAYQTRASSEDDWNIEYAVLHCKYVPVTNGTFLTRN